MMKIINLTLLSPVKKVSQIQINQNWRLPETPFHYGSIPSPYGPVSFVAQDKTLFGLGFTSHHDLMQQIQQGLKQLRCHVPFEASLSAQESWTRQLFSKEPQAISLGLLGTEFYLQVWQALLTVPKGKTASYYDIAQKVNSPKAVRAVGRAVGANPISYLVPCHRILRKDGTLGGYRWGLAIKRALLRAEGSKENVSA